MEILLIIAALYAFGMGGDDETGNGNGGAGDGKKTGADDWDYSYEQWEKVSSGFARKLAWRVYRDKLAEVEVFELAYKTPEGLFSEGEIESQEAAEARGKELGREGQEVA